MKPHKYITSLSAQDMQELADITNITVGPGINATRQNGGWRFEVNQAQLRRWMRAFNQNGGMTCSIDQIDNISLDLT